MGSLVDHRPHSGQADGGGEMREAVSVPLRGHSQVPGHVESTVVRSLIGNILKPLSWPHSSFSEDCHFKR